MSIAPQRSTVAAQWQSAHKCGKAVGRVVQNTSRSCRHALFNGKRLAEVVTMRRQLCDEHVTIENQAAHVEDWRGLKGTPSRDKTQQNSAANVGCGSAADEIVRPSAPCSRTRTTVTLDLPSEERWGYNLPT